MRLMDVFKLERFADCAWVSVQRFSNLAGEGFFVMSNKGCETIFEERA